MSARSTFSLSTKAYKKGIWPNSLFTLFSSATLASLGVVSLADSAQRSSHSELGISDISKALSNIETIIDLETRVNSLSSALEGAKTNVQLPKNDEVFKAGDNSKKKNFA